jgi:Zn-dependent protease with chaperone function
MEGCARSSPIRNGGSPARPAIVWLPQRFVTILALIGLGMGLVVPLAWAERTRLKPGVNLFTPEQDIELGKQNAAQAEKQLNMLNDARVDKYLNDLGQKLAARAPGYKFPYQYKCVNDMAINAFALPGGFIYINRGAIEAADTEAQLAGVMAHETSHAALRHGTNQATKAQLTSVPFAILGGMVGGDSVTGLLGQLAAGFSLNSILLRYSRTDETQADVMGTQILYDAGYDPRALAQFFEKLLAESKGKEPAQFFSDHPNSGNRAQRVDEEIDKLGGPTPNYISDSPEFQAIKRYVKSLPPPPKAAQPKPGAAHPGKPEPPSAHFNTYENDVLELRYPDNWKLNASGSTFTLMPQGGVVQDSKGQSALAYGVMFNSFQPRDVSNGSMTIEQATDQLVATLAQSNPSLRAVGERRRIRVGEALALSGYYSNASLVGGTERDWLISIQRPEGLLFFICVAPESDFNSYDAAFQNVIDSVRFRQ